MLIPNQMSEYGSALLAQDAAHFLPKTLEDARTFARSRSGYAPTPLHDMPALAKELELGSLSIKDEGYRFGLGSFKALGGAYAVVRILLEKAAVRFGTTVGLSEWASPAIRGIAAGMTFGCATDGNHGRSVAEGARLTGARAVIFVHKGVSQARIRAMTELGAEVVRVDGTYDDSIAEASRICENNGWTVVSDTSWPGYESIPGRVMEGYTPLVGEILDRFDPPPTHVFLQAGVGGFAASVSGYLTEFLGAARPKFVIVEPARAACIYASVRAGSLTRITPSEPTVMAMLECYEPSLIAWRILSRSADAFMTVEEQDALNAMRRLSRPVDNDPVVVAGESGGAGLAGLMRVCANPKMRQQIGLGQTARVLVVNTEGATDADQYQHLVGVAPETIVASERVS